MKSHLHPQGVRWLFCFQRLNWLSADRTRTSVHHLTHGAHPKLNGAQAFKRLIAASRMDDNVARVVITS
jgi:hypothetical protein